ncbi:MAG: OmpA family protein [Planctomycetota bacterium]
MALANSTLARWTRFTLAPALAAGLLAGGTGCVSQSALDEARQANKALEEKNLELQDRIDRLQGQLDVLNNAGQMTAEAEAEYRRRIAELQDQVSQLNTALAQAREEIRRLASGGLLDIDPTLADQLEALARANPDLMVWDADRGMIRLRSDLTFGSGSTEVRPAAQTALGSLARVLDIPEAEPYEVQIVGHTDNEKVTIRPNRRFQNNWELSAFRAIAVKDVLEKRGISQSRMSIAGYGEHQPIVPNGANGAEANRRVEIFLRPRSKPVAAPPVEADAPAGGGEVRAAPAAPAAPDDPAAFK